MGSLKPEIIVVSVLLILFALRFFADFEILLFFDFMKQQNLNEARGNPRITKTSPGVRFLQTLLRIVQVPHNQSHAYD